MAGTAMTSAAEEQAGLCLYCLTRWRPAQACPKPIKAEEQNSDLPHPTYASLTRTIGAPYIIRATGALCESGDSLIRAALAFGSSTSISSADFLRFRPRPPLSTVAYSASGATLIGFRPRFPLPLASLVASFSARFARASSRSS